MKVAVLGAGESGVGAAILATKNKYEVWLSDSGQIADKYKQVLSHFDISWEENGHSEKEIMVSDLVVKSPGIPETADLIIKLKEADVKVVSEIEFAYQHTNSTIVAITGSNGKTTTTNLTYSMFEKAGVDVGMAGNVGFSLAKQVAENDHDYYILELSSFQLDGIDTFKPKVAVLLNITPDHLNRYENKLENYAESKFRITMNQDQDDYFIYNYDDKIIRKMIKDKNIKAQMVPFSIKTKLEEGAWIEKDLLNININHNSLSMSIYELALKGKHNAYNSMASAVASRVLQISNKDIRDSLVSFKGIEHRLEHVANVDGIDFINDSKATNVNSVWYALDSVEGDIVWIAGGVDKGNKYADLSDLVKDKVKAIICLGKNNKKIISAFKDQVVDIQETTSVDQAVQLAKLVGRPGDTVLLSPACASFDLFENYEDRGHQFKAAVRAL
ncbi:MAG: UDP-N-acetylmuramoyl-L-alanine--D-glutamate ligase [Flavobacteriales bacterium]|nr:UDP-N-acetylmuramoyl-L-alanine--D-glutamate ligase [Flavobacteriales bacterium]